MPAANNGLRIIMMNDAINFTVRIGKYAPQAISIIECSSFSCLFLSKRHRTTMYEINQIITIIRPKTKKQLPYLQEIVFLLPDYISVSCNTNMNMVCHAT